MPGLIDAATAILAGSERRLAVVSQNVVHVTTPGYKRQSVYAHPVNPDDGLNEGRSSLQVRTDLRPGTFSETGRKLDFAIMGDGFFKLRDGDRTFYSRHGAFRLSADGIVVSPGGYAVQQAGGGDLALENDDVVMRTDGTLLHGDQVVGRVAVFGPFDADSVVSAEGAMFRMSDGGADELDAPRLKQGAIETANTSLGDEMVSMMAAVRQAETGSRLVQTYDELLGRAITSFGQSGR